jgi:hypothetical protein
MSQHFGLIYRLKPGSEPAVEELFRTSGRPDHVVRSEDGSVQGRLLRAMVFIGDSLAVRIIEYEGDLRDVSRHLSRQFAIRELEQRMEPYLAVPRDMTTPEGAQKYFRECGLRCILIRDHDDAPGT